MKYYKILLILGIITIMSVLTITASFAASSEEIKESNGIHVLNYYNKNINIDEVFAWNYKEYTDNHYYKISIKKPYDKKYKIKSVNAKYSVYYSDGRGYFKDINKNYSIKKNNIIIFKAPKSNQYSYHITKMTIKYKTKTKLKSETSNMSNTLANKWKNTQYFHGKKANGMLIAKGSGSSKHGDHKTAYNKLTILTKNKTAKIKSVECMKWVFHRDSSVRSSEYIGNRGYHTLEKETFKGNGKNKLIINLDGKKGCDILKIYYY
ncbi:MAG: hypothetical protein FWE58_05200 [Methanobrevibacter sp.]|nr:hypothetical protein [Methanobrevibacter sp.]